MKTVLCFGDSNTYGYNPSNGGRYDKNTRWTGVLSTLLGEQFNVIEAGCNNRTAFNDNPAGKNYTGTKAINAYLTQNLDYIILFIGINDLQTQYNTEPTDFISGLTKLIQPIKEKVPNAQIFLLAPPKTNPAIMKCFFKTLFDETVIEKSEKLPHIYKQIATTHNCNFINLTEIISTSTKDGLHLEPSEHKTIAEAIYKTLNT